MKRVCYVLFSVFLVLGVRAEVDPTAEKTVLVGESEQVFTLAQENADIRGLTVDDLTRDRPRLYVLDSSKKIFAYRINRNAGKGLDELEYVSSIQLPTYPDGTAIESPRGLALSVESGQRIFYFLNWHRSKEKVKSELWRFNADSKTASSVDLSLYPFRIGDREVLSVAYENGKILVSFNASQYKDHNLRVQRGIILLDWDYAGGSKCEFVKHMPDAGIEACRGLAFMELEGARYLWGTVGNDFIYAAEASTGRGLFHFARPRSVDENMPVWGLAFGRGALWVPEATDGPDRVHRVNATRNLDVAYKGPRILRHLVMTISTEPERDIADPGKVYHYYSRPYSHEQMGNQGIWPETEKFMDTSGASDARLKIETQDPANDTTSRQCFALIEYDNAPSRLYSSRYEIDLWTNPYRKYVYPHRVNRNTEALKGKNYLADDPILYNLKDTRTYDEFIGRVKAHIKRKYGVEADLENPYWAARNVLEYIQDNYYYPSRPKRKPAAVDYDRKHYDANPANLKIELSSREYDKTQIIACSGTSVMVAGAMRYLGIPARWLGTGTEQGAEEWDANGNGLLDEGETAPCTNGHRYSRVWLGANYGWICFDATPNLPEELDYDVAPPFQSQWRYMNRAAAGHLKDKRIVFNVGSGLVLPLFRDFEYDEQLAVDNNCGGDQRYNLQGRFEKPELWKLARHSISVRNVCFIEGVTLSGPRNETEIRWVPVGQWNRDLAARLSFLLQQVDPGTRKPNDVAILARNIPYDLRSVKADLSPYSGKRFRIIVRKDGDPETGGHSGWFELH